MALGEPWSVEGPEPKSQETAERSAVRLLMPAADRTKSINALDPQTAALVEAVLARLNERLDRTEAATSEAIQGLKSAFDRLASSGDRGLGDRPTVEHRFEALARDLHAQVEDVRSDLVQSLKSSADNRFSQLSKALEAMGQHMLSAEHRSSAALEQVSGEVARLGGAMDQRLGRYEIVQSDALERLSAEIDRIADRLSERIASSERRSSQAITEAKDEFSLLASSMAERTFETTTDLSERIRQSEERTARLLEGARAKLDQRVVMPAPVIAEVEPQAEPEPERVMAATRPSEPTLINPFIAMDDVGPEGSWLELGDVSRLSLSSLDEVKDGEIDEDDGANFFSSGLAAELAAKINGLEAERADDLADEVGSGLEPVAEAYEPKTAAPWSVIQGDEDVLFAPAPSKGHAVRRKAPIMPRRAIIASLAVVSVAVAIAGLAILGSGQQTLSPAQSFQTLMTRLKGERQGPVPIADASQMVQAPEPKTTPAPRAAAAAHTPDLTDSAVSVPIESVTQSKSVISSRDYATLLKSLSSADGTGLAKLKRLAEQGYAPAQNDLGKLFESGDLGLTKNWSMARFWTERSAKSGVVEAMHRMGLYHYYGQGGAQNPVLAAQWFRRAAERGMLDSQYNLAQLYETGVGVTANSAEAYRWYLIAAQSGDQEALKKVASLRPQVPSRGRAEIERQARAFKAGS
jgi:localization factor PodJL